MPAQQLRLLPRCESPCTHLQAMFAGSSAPDVSPQMMCHAVLQAMFAGSREAGLGAEVKRRILMGTYALSAGYYDAVYKRAQQARLSLATCQFPSDPSRPALLPPSVCMSASTCSIMSAHKDEMCFVAQPKHLYEACSGGQCSLYPARAYIWTCLITLILTKFIACLSRLLQANPNVSKCHRCAR